MVPLPYHQSVFVLAGPGVDLNFKVKDAWLELDVGSSARFR